MSLVCKLVSKTLKFMVPKEGLEPSCRRRRQILSLVRLPFRHFGAQ